MSTATPLICVMGVSASGKTTVGEGLARELGVAFVDGDALHSPRNRAKMAAGQPLTDEDRWPWLDAVGQAFADAVADGLIIACSALRREYRDRIRAIVPDVRFVHLDGPDAVLLARATRRSHEFMPASLLASQLGLLERLDGDENGMVVSIERAPEEIVAQVRAAFR